MTDNPPDAVPYEELTITIRIRPDDMSREDAAEVLGIIAAKVRLQGDEYRLTQSILNEHGDRRGSWKLYRRLPD